MKPHAILAAAACALAVLPASTRAQAPPTTVPRCRLGGSDVSVSCVALGTLHVHELLTPQGVLEYLNAALAIGVTTIDTSDVYRDAIPLLGQAFALQPGLRERFEVVAKMDITGAWPSGFGFDSGSVYDSSAGHLSSVLQTYLTSFNTTYVDILMLHHQDFLLNLTEVSTLVKGWIAAGTVRAFGVSNFDMQTFGALAAAMAPYPLVANEIELSVLQPAAFVDGRVSYHYGQGSTILAWGPLGGDCWGGANRLFNVLSLDSSQRTPRIRAGLSTVAAALNTTADVAAVAWLLRHPSAIVPILGTMNATRLAQQSLGALAAAAAMTRGQWYHIADAAKIPIW